MSDTPNVDEELLAKIEKSAQQLGMTRGEFVRAAIVMHFESRPAAVADKLAALSAALSLVRRNQPRLLVALLAEIGKLPIDQAKEIARVTLVN